MFIVIQEIQLKKPQKSGNYKEYEVTTSTYYPKGEKSMALYSYWPKYDAGYFERPHREAYKISVRESYRDHGKVKQKQCVLGTLSYYDIATDWGLYDCIETGLNRAAKMFSNTDNLYDLAEAKLEPIKKRIKREYHKTEEYKTVRERDKVQKRYQKAKAAFAKKYSVDENQYDFCYDVFGHVMNQEYLDEIIKKAEAYSSYYDYSSSNYGYSNSCGGGSSYQQDYSSCFKTNSSNYTNEEKGYLKQFYRKLAAAFHPDVNPGKDTTEEMKLINKLKDEWGL